MPNDRTFLDILVKAIRQAGTDSDVSQMPPAMLLWPDPGREWEPLLPYLRPRLPLLTLGPYAPATRCGPSVWLRCMVAHALADQPLQHELPVIYLPGISNQAFHHSDLRPVGLDLLLEPWLRGSPWLRPDGCEWSAVDFFTDATHGIGIGMRDDDYTKKAMLRVLPAIAGLTLDALQAEAPWKAKDFEGLIEADVSKLIALGESETMEFKATGRWGTKTNAANPDVEFEVIGTVAGFLNSSRGGTLLIGVTDDGQVCGIELDYPVFSKKEPSLDDYQLWLSRKLRDSFGQEFAPFIHISFQHVGECTVCKVVVDPAPWPAICPEKKPNRPPEDIFCLRSGNATQKLCLREIISYCKIRWP